MKSPYEYEWVVLFGGARREEVVFSMLNGGVCIKSVLVPRNQSEALADSIQKLVNAGLEIVDVASTSIVEKLKMHAGKALLSIGFPYIIPADLLELFPIRLNIHPTLLPYYKGPTSGANVIIQGEQKTGSTVHVMEAEMDAGAIVAQSEVKLTKFDTVRSMQKKVYHTEPQLILAALKKIDNGEPLIQQDNPHSHVYSKRTPNDSQIDPRKSLIELFDCIRACDPVNYPAHFFIEGQKVCIKLWRTNRSTEEDDESI